LNVIISIVVPIYNVAQYLPSCLNTILNQTFKNFELILVNDGSTDESGEICDKFSQQDNRINVIHKDNNGVSAARNTGIEQSKGKYLAFVDPDDHLEASMYEKLYQKAEATGAEIVVCPIRTINQINNTVSTSAIWTGYENILNKQDINNHIIPSIINNKPISLASSVNKLYKRELFDAFNIRFEEKKSHSEDMRLNYKLIQRIDSLAYIEEPLYKYFIRKRDSLTQVFRPNLLEYVRDNKRLLLELCKSYNLEKYSLNVKNHFTHVTLSYLNEVVLSHLDNKKKKRILSEIINDEEFIEDVKFYDPSTLYYEVLRKICLKKDEKLLFQLILNKNRFQFFYKNFIKMSNFGTGNRKVQ
jgi:glycosyltransferase involved in cell wall biosynthesis